MLSVAEALTIVLAQVTPRSPVTAPLDSAALGLVLAEDVTSDLDMPPFDKAMMDGFALRSADLHVGMAELAIIGEIGAGQTPTLGIQQGQAIRIMTGAPIPSGADAVVMIERCEFTQDKVRINDPKLTPGSNILTKGREMRNGEIVLHAGARLRPQDFGVLATVGRSAVQVHPAPRVAIISTGDELVDASVKPGPGQIRNGNGPMLMAQTARARGVPRNLGIARDEPSHLRTLIAEGLQADMLLLSGGVSAGKFDLVPGVLAELGVEMLFHKVEMKPGKPVLFGVKQRTHAEVCLVFGLPGNPVASLVCFELFVRPAIRAMLALPAEAHWVRATLAADYAFRTDRPTYHPAHLKATDTGWAVEAAAWFGSPDLRGAAPANALLLLPAGDHRHQAGLIMDVLRVDDFD